MLDKSDILYASRAQRSGGVLIPISIATLLISMVINETIGTTQIVSFGFYTLHTIDISVALFSFYIVSNLSNIIKFRNIYQYLIMLFFIIVLINFIRGMLQSTGPALLQARFFLPLALVPMAACLVRNPDLTIEKNIRYGVWAGIVLSTLVLLRSTLKTDLFIITNIDASQLNDGGRGISAQGAMGILGAFWLTFVRSTKDKTYLKIWTTRIFLITGLFASLQGTVILATTVTILLYAVIGNSRTRAIGLLYLFIICPAIFIINYYVADVYTTGDFMRHRLDNMATRNSVWSSFWDLFSSSPLYIKLLGWPFGGFPEINVNINGSSVIWINSLHSMYFSGLKIAGYLSIPTLFLALFILAVKSIFLYMATAKKSYLICNLIITSCFLYFGSYEAGSGVALVIFWAILIQRSIDQRSFVQNGESDDKRSLDLDR